MQDDARGCFICTIEKPCLYDLESDPAEVHDLSANMTALLTELNDTYTKLVFERRQPVPLNFSTWSCGNNDRRLGGSGVVVARQPPSCSSTPSRQCWRTSGHALGSVKNCSAAADCCAACSNTTGCATFSLDLSTGTCWILSAGAKAAGGSSPRTCLSGTSAAPGPSPSPPPSPSPCSGRWGCFIGPECVCDGRVDSAFRCVKSS